MQFIWKRKSKYLANKCLLDPAETWDTEKFEQTLLDFSLYTHLVHTIVLSMVTALFLESVLYLHSLRQSEGMSK